MNSVEELIERINFRVCPKHLREEIQYYISQGRPLGGFLTAVFSNNLKESFNRADDTNKHLLGDLVSFIQNELPAPSQGSFTKVEEWMKHRGLSGWAEKLI